MAFRLTGDKLMWDTARSIAKGNGLGDIGESPGAAPGLNPSTGCDEPEMIFGLLDLYEKTGERAYLDLATRVGRNILGNRFDKGFFVENKRLLYARFDAVRAPGVAARRRCDPGQACAGAALHGELLVLRERV